VNRLALLGLQRCNRGAMTKPETKTIPGDQVDPANKTALAVFEPAGDAFQGVLVLDDADQKLADELLAKHGSVYNALIEFANATIGVIGAFRKVCVEMRAAGIINQPARLVLTRAGWAKSRISEACRIIEADDRTFGRFSKLDIGVRVALQEARGSAPTAGRGPGELGVQNQKAVSEVLEKIALQLTGKRGVRYNYTTAKGVWQLTFKPKKSKPVAATKGTK